MYIFFISSQEAKGKWNRVDKSRKERRKMKYLWIDEATFFPFASEDTKILFPSV